MFNFEKLEVWQEAISFADAIYSASRSFPDDERFGLTSQIRRAAVSISANLAEGSGRESNKEFCRFVAIAYGSLLEVVSHLRVAQRQRMLTDEVHAQAYNQAETLAKRISKLRAHLIKET
jgi:four helix bundle protein